MNHDVPKEAGSPQYPPGNGKAAMLEAAPVPLIVLDAQGKIINVNSAMETETGHPRTKLVGTDFWDCFAYPDDARAVFEATLRDGFARDRPLDLIRREGFPVPVMVSAASYNDADGNTAGIVAAPRNIGVFKRTEAELHKRREELEKKVLELTAQIETANRELDAFPFWVIEDLKAPFNTIATSTTALVQDDFAKLDADGRGSLDRIRAASAATNEMMDGLRRLSSIGRQKVDRVTVDLTALAQRVASSLQQRESGRQVTFVITPQMSAHGDPGLLLTVFEKLMGNAWKSLANESAPVIEVGLLQGEDVRAFYVRDNSFSSPLKNVPSAARATEFPDAGVSRATVRRIIHRHGGRVWAESHRGKGTAFYFTIPG